MKLICFLCSLFCLQSALPGQEKEAQKIIDKCISAHGGDRYKEAHFSFDFRKHHYTFHYDHGKYRYERLNDDPHINDFITNDGFERWQDGNRITLSEKDATKYANSVNSVHYFAFLPFFLNDQAVRKKYLGSTTIKNKKYAMIQVTFKKEGGGDDHDDVYVYWINERDFTLDYLAYSFHVDDGGVRFRSAYNRRKISGITFQDYINYKHDKDTSPADMGELYEKGALTELSRIELKNVKRIDKPEDF